MTAFNATEWQQLKDRLRANPASYSQDHFCGAVRCIAGHLFQLRGTPLVYITGLDRWGYVDERGYVQTLPAADDGVYAALAEKTGLKPEFDWVFRVVSDWPEPYQSAYTAATTERERVEVACQVIDHVIARHVKPVLRCGYTGNGAIGYIYTTDANMDLLVMDHEQVVELELTPEQVEQLRSIGFPIAGGGGDGAAASKEVA